MNCAPTSNYFVTMLTHESESRNYLVGIISGRVGIGSGSEYSAPQECSDGFQKRFLHHKKSSKLR